MTAILNGPLRSGLPSSENYRGKDSTCPYPGREGIKCLDCDLPCCLMDDRDAPITFSDTIIGRLAFYLAGDNYYTGIPKFLRRNVL